MKKRFSEEQIIKSLKEHEAGKKAADLVREHNISEQTFCRWKSKYGGMDASEAKRLKQLEDENRCLKELVVDFTLDNHIKGYNFKKRLKPAEKRKVAAEIQAKYKISERRACRLSGINRSRKRFGNNATSFGFSRKVETIRLSASAHHAEKGKHQYKS